MKFQKYSQTTVESCLACCLYQLAEQKINRKKELEMLFYALKFSKTDFVAGHLDFLKKKLKVKTIRYVHNKILFNAVKKTTTVQLEQRKINLEFIDELLKTKPLIVSIDDYVMFKSYHYPHFLLIKEKTKKGYLIYEPWEGKVKEISKKILKEGLKSYLVRLWMAPQVITLK